MCRNLQAVQNI